MIVVLKTDRLILRQFADTEEDAGLLHELDSDPDVMRYIGPFGLPTVVAYRERLRTVWLPSYAKPGRGILAVHEGPDGPFVGWIFLRPATESRFAAEAGWACSTDLEIGYRFHKAVWGRGLATEVATAIVRSALADPAVTAVVGATLATNRASARVLEKCGLTRVREFALPGFTDPAIAYARPQSGSDRA